MDRGATGARVTAACEQMCSLPADTSEQGDCAKPDPDADIVELVGEGERDTALRRLFERYGRAVYRLCCRELRDDVRAEDVWQRVFVEAHRDLATFSGRSRLRTWLFGIARHRLLDERRSCARREQGLRRWIAACAPESPDPRPLVERRLDDDRVHRALVACLAKLPPDVQVALSLRYEHDLTFHEMAELCGEKAGTLQARVARALDRLRTQLARRMPDDAIERSARAPGVRRSRPVSRVPRLASCVHVQR